MNKESAASSERPSFLPYYRAAISKSKGFKPVPGGTGLGKTSAIPELIATHTDKRKFIYCANRIQLLDEMEKGLKAEEVGFVHLRRDSELVKSVIENDKGALFRLLESSELHALKVRNKRFSEVVSRLEQAFGLPDSSFVQDAIRREASYLLYLFKDLFYAASDETKRWLRRQEVVRKLFPYIAFQDDESCKVLLITVQKLFHGFFDGEATLNLSRLTRDRAGHIIFLDEFDFLESNLVNLICESSELSAPFQFVGLFYREMKNRLLSDDYLGAEDTAWVRNEVGNIVQLVGSLQQNEDPAQNVPYPETRLFTSKDEKLRNNAIFQTNRTVVNAPLYLEVTERSFDIRVDGAVRAYRLFNTVREAMNRILSLFKRLETRNPGIYEELRRQCFENTTFREELAKIRQLPEKSRFQPTRFDKLLDSGYSLYEIKDLRQRSDPDEVELSHYAVYTTPEKLLLTLAQNNLVFGLSATGDIERCVGNFNITWLRRQDANVMDITPEDKEIIAQLNQCKAAKRNNEVSVEVAPVRLSDSDEFSKLKDYVDALALTEEFGKPTQHPKERVYSFFATLEWLLTKGHRAGDAHLLFYNSFKQIEYALNEGDESEPPLFEVEKDNVGRELFHTYRLTYKGRTFNVVFYNAENARNLGQHKDISEAFEKLFWKDDPLLLVTTYPSAGNGINLQFRPSEDSQELQDFTSVHLLDAPFFYLGEVQQGAKNERQAIKKRIWYSAKLTEAKLQTEARFKGILGNIRGAKLDASYKDSNDALLNRVSSYIQALGRVERTWTPTPNQSVRLHPEVYKDFERFCTHEEFQYIVSRREALFSSNTQRVLEQIRQKKPEGFKKRYFKIDEGLTVQNQRCKEAVRALLERLAASRRGADDDAARQDWKKLRRAVLQHDFQNEILENYYCLYHYPHWEDGVLYLDNRDALHPPERSSSDLRSWSLNSAYSKILSHTPLDDEADKQTIRRYFELQSYELGFNDFGGTFFVPYCYQAILLGAIGEEAISALLKKERLPFEDLPNALFELADIKLSGVPWYIDCKNYSAATLEDITLPLDDFSRRTPLDEASFREDALRKRAQLGSDAKLIYLNLFGDERPLRYFGGDFTTEVSTLREASFVVVQGVLDRAHYTEAFNTFLSDTHNLLEVP